MIEVHKRIEKVRKQNGVTKAFLAKKLGMSSMGYHYLSTGRNPISTERLQVLAEALGVPADEFLRPELNESVITDSEEEAI